MTRLDSACVVASMLLLGLGASASSLDDGLKLCILDETAMPGGIVQMKVVATEVTPISGGRPGFAYDSSTFGDIAGFGLFAPDGEAAGAAVISGNHVAVSYVTSAPQVGEYPLLAIALPVRRDAVPGQHIRFALDALSMWNVNGLFTRAREIKPATVTIGGTLSITDVEPGEGLQPAGTVVSVRGLGFGRDTRMRIKDVAVSRSALVAPDEIQLTLAADTDMTGQRIDAVNRDGARVSYYAYGRGIPMRSSARALLNATEPFFSGLIHSTAVLGPIESGGAGQYAGIALQNPSRTSVPIGIELHARDGSLLHFSTATLLPRERAALRVSEWLDGVTAPPDAYVTVIASAPIHLALLLCDETSWSVIPVLPLSSSAR